MTAITSARDKCHRNTTTVEGDSEPLQRHAHGAARIHGNNSSAPV